MKLIAKQPYIKVEREVVFLDQVITEEERTIYLYEDKIVTQHHQFPLTDVLDISHKRLGEDGGLLYLHTNHGVYSYYVKSSPNSFIEQFKSLF